VGTSAEFLSQLPFHLNDKELGFVFPEYKLLVLPQERAHVLAIECLIFEWNDKKVERCTNLGGKIINSHTHESYIYSCALFSSGNLQALIARVSLHADDSLIFVELFANSKEELAEHKQSLMALFNEYLRRLENTQQATGSDPLELSLARKCRMVFGKPKKDIPALGHLGTRGLIVPLPNTARLS